MMSLFRQKWVCQLGGVNKNNTGYFCSGATEIHYNLTLNQTRNELLPSALWEICQHELAYTASNYSQHAYECFLYLGYAHKSLTLYSACDDGGAVPSDFFPFLCLLLKKVQNSINEEYRGCYKEHVNNWQYFGKEIFLLRIIFWEVGVTLTAVAWRHSLWGQS